MSDSLDLDVSEKRGDEWYRGQLEWVGGLVQVFGLPCAVRLVTQEDPEAEECHVLWFDIAGAERFHEMLGAAIEAAGGGPVYRRYRMRPGTTLEAFEDAGCVTGPLIALFNRNAALALAAFWAAMGRMLGL